MEVGRFPAGTEESRSRRLLHNAADIEKVSGPRRTSAAAVRRQDSPSRNSRSAPVVSAGLAALQAIDAKDADKLFEIGEEIERACEACHSQYWYPNEKIPPVPTSGAQ